jgi:PPOX class probable FMN-dependent enzyme
VSTDGNGLATRFKDVVTSAAELRRPLGAPNPRAAAKVVSVLDETCRRFIARSPFLVMATTNAAGDMDVSPKGDPAGFVTVLDDKTVAIPDRLGNRRLDSLCNILDNPRVALIFMIPSVSHTLRVNGRALIVRDDDLLETMAVNDRLPDQALVVSVEEAFFHCSKCMIRSRLWNPDEWPDATDVPTLAEALVAHAKLSEPVETIQKFIDDEAAQRLY